MASCWPGSEGPRSEGALRFYRHHLSSHCHAGPPVAAFHVSCSQGIPSCAPPAEDHLAATAAAVACRRLLPLSPASVACCCRLLLCCRRHPGLPPSTSPPAQQRTDSAMPATSFPTCHVFMSCWWVWPSCLHHCFHHFRPPKVNYCCVLLVGLAFPLSPRPACHPRRHLNCHSCVANTSQASDPAVAATSVPASHLSSPQLGRPGHLCRPCHLPFPSPIPAGP